MSTGQTEAPAAKPETKPGTEIATTRPKLLSRLADEAGLDSKAFYGTIKALCGCQGATDEHFAALMMVADTYKLKPILRQLYLIQSKRGIEVVIPVDGWIPLLVKHPDYIAHDVTTTWEDKPFVSKPVACTIKIWTKSRKAEGLPPFEHSELFSECWRDTGPWKQFPARMLAHKAIIQGTRHCFGIYVADADEAAAYAAATDVAITQEPQGDKPLSVQLSKELPPDEPEKVDDDVIDAEVEVPGAVQGADPAVVTQTIFDMLFQRCKECSSSREAAEIAMDVGKHLSAASISQEEADTLSKMVARE